MSKKNIFFLILFYSFLAFVTFFTGFDLKEVFAVELWGYNFSMNGTDIRYKNGVNGSENNLTLATNEQLTIGVGLTSYITYNPYWNIYLPALVNGHNYTLQVPICTTGSDIYQTTNVLINGVYDNRVLNSYVIVGMDNSPYANTSSNVYNFQSCGIVYLNFDYIGTSSTNLTDLLTFNTTRGSNVSTRWAVLGYNFTDNGTSNTFIKLQAQAILNAINSNAISNIESNTSDINSNLNYDGSSSDITSPDDSNLNAYLSNNNELLNNSNISDFDFNDYKISNTNFYGAINIVLGFLTLFFQIRWIPVFVGVILTLGIVGTLLNRKS